MAGDGSDPIALNETLRLLREEVSSLVKTVPGPVASVALRAGETSLEIAWGYTGSAPAPLEGPGLAAGHPEPAPAPPPDPGLIDVASQLVGTFYLAPEPGADPFVAVGSRVEVGQTLGIVEAMKLMNPVTSEHAGDVVEILADDAEPVEFGQVLVRIRTGRP